MPARDGELEALLKKSGSVILSGSPLISGSATSPSTFQIFLTSVTLPAGTYTVNWTVTLSGTIGANEANNFGLTLGSGTTIAAPSVNPAAAGSYPQAPVTFTLTQPDTLTLKSWSAAPTAGAVYGGSLSTTGNGTLYFDPDNANQRWEITGIVVSTNQGTRTPYPVASYYIGPETSQANLRGQSASGNQDTFAGFDDLGNADTLAVTWTGGVAGTVASAQVTGAKYTRRT